MYKVLAKCISHAERPCSLICWVCARSVATCEQVFVCNAPTTNVDVPTRNMQNTEDKHADQLDNRSATSYRTHVLPLWNCRGWKQLLFFNKTGNVHITLHWGAFANHCYCWKTISIIFVCVCACVRASVGAGSVGVCMPMRARCLAHSACNAYAPYCDVICGLWLQQIFRQYLINSTIFGGKKITEREKVCFDFLYKFF
jgi:hypothetical protein